MPYSKQSKDFIKKVTTALNKTDKKVAKFAPVYLAGVPASEFANTTMENIVPHLISTFNFVQTRTDMPIQIRVFNPDYSHHTIVEVLLDNQPFVMDTIWEELNYRDMEVHHSFHPLMVAVRNKKNELTSYRPWEPNVKLAKNENLESILHIEFDRQQPSDLPAIEKKLTRVLQEASWAVQDFGKVTEHVESILKGFEKSSITSNPHKDEDIAFLKWLLDGNYIFLGYRHYFLEKSGKKIKMGLTRKSGLGIMRHDKESSIYTPKELGELPPNMKYYVTGDRILTITRALTKSRVHRRADMDYIGIKEFDKKGDVIGEHRFLGLFSSRAYTANVNDIPIISRKIQEVLKREERIGVTNHNYKALINILETYPRDELFQISTDDLHRISMGILHLYERRKVKLFIRRVNHERMISAMVFIPRDRMNSTLRRKIEAILMTAYNGESIEVNVQIGESALARIFMKIRTRPPEPPAISDAAVEKLVVEAASSWEDDMRDALIEIHGEHDGLKYFNTYAKSFKAGYREHTPVDVAVQDIANLSTMTKDADFHVALYLDKGGETGQLKVFKSGESIDLSSIMPTFDNMGLFVKQEHPNRVSLPEGRNVFIQDFTVGFNGNKIKKDEVVSTLCQALTMAWHGDLESDTLNRLLLTGEIDVRQVIILRAYVAYMQQVGMKYSQEYIRDTLVKHGNIANMITDLFDARFDINLSDAKSKKLQESICRRFNSAMNNVAVLDEDIILTRLKSIVMATIRTNAWQRENITDPLAFKIRSSMVPNLVKPHPLFEIFVYSSHVEGIHLRGGMTARGGLRWSDRPADFRTEILGLMKAQMTKNAVIVPVGSKGGFVLKTPPCNLKDPSSCDRDALMRHVEANYSTFIRGLLSVTDNLIDGKVVPPRKLKRHDGDDPYLVVAADKGTATFSDLANSVAIGADFWDGKHNGFWLGDAFASGGSNGYDHKKMGITARGAWECVKHHFRHLGKDIQKEDFTVMGVGDMSGDVFGNGMLLSKHIRLKGAYNHLYVFVDPNPDAAKSYKERQRLFNNPRLNWADYDKKLISKGGGVFSRKDKSIKLSPEMQEMLHTKEKELSPDELIRAMLKMDVELIWNGGIGTFVKASHESHADVGDRANDTIRVNAKNLKAKVIGEGGNLGLTQLARIEYALNGGAVNTDAIDNSAGVDCSDHEVNIKILLTVIQQAEKLSDKVRNDILAKMEDDVGLQVLKDNYYHAQALSIKQRAALKDHATNKQLMLSLEKKGALDPAVEFLPTYEDMDARIQKGKGLTRPELSVLLAYAKMDAFNAIIGTSLPDEKCLEHYLIDYFPALLKEKYSKHMHNHRLKREIIATQVANELVNRMGPTFLNRMSHETGNTHEDIARAYLISRYLINAQYYWELIESLDNKVSMDAQMKMLETVKKLVEYTTFWFLRHAKHPMHVEKQIDTYRPIFSEIKEYLTIYHTKDMASRHRERAKEWQEMGVSKEISQHFSRLATMTCAPDVAEISLQTKQSAKRVMEVHFMVGEKLSVDNLHQATRNIPVTNNWQRVGSLAIIDDLYTYQQMATSIIISSIKTGDAEEGIEAWVTAKGNMFEQYQSLVQEVKNQPVASHAMLSSILGQLKGLVLR